MLFLACPARRGELGQLFKDLGAESDLVTYLDRQEAMGAKHSGVSAMNASNLLLRVGVVTQRWLDAIDAAYARVEDNDGVWEGVGEGDAKKPLAKGVALHLKQNPMANSIFLGFL